MSSFPIPIPDVATLFACAFFAILFLQSGIDKLVDRKGNLDWLQGHFAASPLKGTVPLLLATITVVELMAGACSLVGAVLSLSGERFWPQTGLCLACAALLMLFFGQRVAKDYAGAATIATYFGVAVLSLVVTTLK